MGMCYNAYLFTLLIPPAILSYINADLGPDPRYTWITISWNLGGAMFVTIGGRLSDIFGRRYFFLAGASTLIIGSIISATGQSIEQMIAGGAIFGAGSGFLEMSFGAVQVSSMHLLRQRILRIEELAVHACKGNFTYHCKHLRMPPRWPLRNLVTTGEFDT